LFQAIMNIFKRASKKRNRLAHNPWGYCDELPDALLSVEIEAAVGVMVRLEKIIREKTGTRWPAERNPELEPDPTKVWVYKEADFKELVGEMNSVRRCITFFHYFVAGGPQRAGVKKVCWLAKHSFSRNYLG
jgi:hypothetical protein